MGAERYHILQTGQPIVFSDSNQFSLTCTNFVYYSCPDRPDLVKMPVAVNPRRPCSAQVVI